MTSNVCRCISICSSDTGDERLSGCARRRGQDDRVGIKFVSNQSTGGK